MLVLSVCSVCPQHAPPHEPWTLFLLPSMMVSHTTRLMPDNYLLYDYYARELTEQVIICRQLGMQHMSTNVTRWVHLVHTVTCPGGLVL